MWIYGIIYIFWRRVSQHFSNINIATRGPKWKNGTQEECFSEVCCSELWAGPGLGSDKTRGVIYTIRLSYVELDSPADNWGKQFENATGCSMPMHALLWRSFRSILCEASCPSISICKCQVNTESQGREQLMCHNWFSHFISKLQERKNWLGWIFLDFRWMKAVFDRFFIALLALVSFSFSPRRSHSFALGRTQSTATARSHGKFEGVIRFVKGTLSNSTADTHKKAERIASGNYITR